MAPVKTTPRVPFDEEKFSKMVEPFTVRIEKVKGMARTPIPLPASEDPTLEPGTGFSRDNVRGMENWLVTEWSGGGLYDISITDSSPQPLTMKWSPWWDPQTYPEIIPPPLRDAARQQPASYQHQPQQPQIQVRPMSAFPNGLPGAPQQYPQQPQYAQPYYAAPQYAMPQPPPVGTPQWNAWRNEAEDRRREDELRALREKEQLRERQAIEATHKAELERERAASEARFARQEQGMNELRAMIAQLTQSLTQAQTKPPGDSPELVALRAQLAQQQAALEAQNREREAERRDTMMRDMIKQSNDAVQKQIDALMRSMEQQAAAAREASTNRPDQMLMMMQQMSRDNADALKAMSLESSRSLERLQGFMMTPQAMFDLASKQSASMETATEKVSNTFGKVMDMQQRVIENAINLQPGGSSAIDLAREGIDKVTSLVERYTSTKSTEARFAMDAQVKVAQAQAAAISAQMNPGTVHIPPAPIPQSQLAGAPVNAAQPDNVTPISSARKNVERFGRTDEEWFGPLLPEVLKLRAGVARFIESCNMVPPRVGKDGELEGVSPEQAAMAIIQAVGMCMQNNVVVQALADLLFMDRFADFVSVLIPDAPKTYRDDTTSIVIDLARKISAENGGDTTALDAAEAEDTAGDDGDDDGDESEDGAQPEVSSAPPPTAKPAAPVRRLH